MNSSLLKKVIKEEIIKVLEEEKEFKHLKISPSGNVIHKDCGGHFKEMSLHDDWEGMKTCDRCGYRIKSDTLHSFTKKK